MVFAIGESQGHIHFKKTWLQATTSTTCDYQKEEREITPAWNTNDESCLLYTSQKGGIGKSTVTALAASYLHNVKGYNVAVVDCEMCIRDRFCVYGKE